MSVASGGSVDKAWFFNEEIGSWFEVQYNPLSFNLERSAKWDEKPVPGNAPVLEYGGTALASVSMELMFDTTHDGSDVRSSWVDKLLHLLNPTYKPSDGQGSDADKRRPARVWFQWGSQNMLCVIESVSTSFMMFSQDGTPEDAEAAAPIDLEEVYTWGAASTVPLAPFLPFVLVVVLAPGALVLFADGGEDFAISLNPFELTETRRSEVQA